MKEFDYSKWDNKPREMWVWNNNMSDKRKLFIVYIANDKGLGLKKVLTNSGTWYEHCAEIEPTRRMTNYELAHWLWEGTQVGEFREFSDDLSYISWNYNSYNKDEEKEEVPSTYRIRINGGEWKEPFIEE